LVRCLFAAICWLLLLLPAQGLCTTGTGCKACLIASTHANKYQHAATRMVSCSCLQAVLNTVVCTGLVQGLCNMATQPNTGCKACLTASTHANRHASFECSAALTVQLRLFAIYSGYCRMQGLAACLETVLQGPLTFK
jgi:hypothetical protein